MNEEIEALKALPESDRFSEIAKRMLDVMEERVAMEDQVDKLKEKHSTGSLETKDMVGVLKMKVDIDKKEKDIKALAIELGVFSETELSEKTGKL
jgi:hypothetical protein